MMYAAWTASFIWWIFIVADATIVEVSSELQETQASNITDNIHFYAYTRQNRTIPWEIILGDDTTLGRLDTTKDIKYVAHGFTNNAFSEMSMAMKDGLLHRDDVIVIMVDWQNLSRSPDYEGASQRTQVVGRRLAQLIKWLATRDFSLSRTHLIGFSLGSQVMGAAGGSLTSPKVSRITGIDPSYKHFRDADTDGRLDPSDAEFVDIIHTNGGDYKTAHVAFLAPVGHQDFYLNGGQRQPGCYITISERLVAPDYYEPFDFCSHFFSYLVFLETLYDYTSFVGHACIDYDHYKQGLCLSCENSTCPQIGYDARPGVTGSFYRTTRIASPYKGKELFVKLTTTSDQVNTTGIISLTLQGYLTLPSSDTAEVLNGETQIGPSATIYAVIAIHSSISDFVSGQLKFDSDPVNNGTDPLSIRIISVKDPKTNSIVCGGPIHVPRKTAVSFVFERC